MVRLFWILSGDARLAIVSRPCGGGDLDADMRELRAAGVDVVASLLTPAEERELALTDEAGAAARAGMRFVAFPIDDRGVPCNMLGFLRFVRGLENAIGAGQAVAVHCRAGIGRSGLTVAAVLVLRGASADHAWESVSAQRGCQVPDTDEQRHWLADFDRRHHDLERIGSLFGA